MSKSNRLSNLRLAAIIACCSLMAFSLLVAAGWYFVCDWVPDSITTQLRGATRDEVRQLLGEPTDHSSNTDDTPDDASKWIYTRGCRLAEFQVRFGSDGRVESWGYDR
jgi:hypothetical protein